nr:IQ domain containing protein [Hymenolepis microstoma]
MEINDLPKDLPLDLLRRVVARESSIAVKETKLYYNGSAIKSGISPKRLFKGKNGILEIECRFKNPSKATKIHLGKRVCKYSNTDEISLYIYKGEERNKDTHPDYLDLHLDSTKQENVLHVIEIEWMNNEKKKPFLGGYRRKTDGVIYHNATAQTKPKLPKIPPVPFFTRDTQTYEVKHEGIDTVENASTAMPKPGFFVTNLNDRVITPGVYESFEEYEARLNQSAIIIQKWVRRWLAKRRVARLKQLLWEYNDFISKKERKYLQDKIDRVNQEYERRANPQNHYDIDRLFKALEEWRLKELDKIYHNSEDMVIQKANMALLLDRETEFIKMITEKQNNLSECGRMQKDKWPLEKASRPIKWISKNNSMNLEAYTPAILKARDLFVLYENLRMDCLTKTERMDLLLTVKKLAGSYPSKVSCDLIGLIERETEFMLRGIPPSMLVGLRQRVLLSFVRLCKDTEFNPAIAKFLPIPDKKIPNARAQMWSDIYKCISCGRFLRSRAFYFGSRSINVKICKFCWRQSNRGNVRIDLEPYKRILQDLRDSEYEILIKTQRANIVKMRQLQLLALDKAVEEHIRIREAHDDTPVDVNTLLNLEGELPELNIEKMTNHFELMVNISDIYYLVSDVWDGKSAFSGCSDLDVLKLCRWNVTQPWAPWNTILLTKKEADLHMELKDIPSNSLYSATLLDRIHQKFVTGRNAFKMLCKVGKYLIKEPFESTETKTEDENLHIQPPEHVIPFIKGEERMSDYGISTLKEIWNLSEIEIENGKYLRDLDK